MAQGVTIDFNANVARFSSAIDKATADLNKFQTNADRMAKNVKGAFGGLAAGLSVAAFTAYGKHVLDTADKLQDLSDRTDVAVNDLAGLVQPAKLADTSLEAVAKTIGKLNLSFSQARDGSKEQAEALRDLNITSSDARERFFQLADAYANASDKNKVLSDIQKVLGRQYEEVLPLIKQGGDALREQVAATQSFTDAMTELAPHAGLLNDNLDKLKISSAGITANLLNDLVPAVNDITKAMLEAYEQGGLLESLWVGLGGLGTLAFTDELDSVNTKIRDAEAEVKALRAALNDPGIGFMKYGALSDAELVKRIGDTNAKIGDLMRERKAMVDAATGEKPDPRNTPVPVPTTPKTDPLASFLKATDTARLKEYSNLTADLLRRMAGARGDTTVYVQALDEINKKFADLVLQQQQFDLGGGVMGDFEDLQSYQEALNEARAEQQAYNDTLIASGRAIEEQFGNPMNGLTERLAYLDWLLEQGKISFEAWGNAGLDATEKAAAAMGDVTANTQDQFKELKDAIEGWSRDAAQAMVDFAITGESSVTDMVNGILAQLARMTAQKYITDPLFNAIGSMLPDLVPNADGGVYSAPGLSAYSGTVVNQPTVFPFARGIGLMGEAGPEAILPLTRVNGKLGVQAQGGGSGDVQVNVYNAPAGTSATVKESVDSRGARKIDIVLSEIVGAELRRPGSPANSAIRQGFGVPPTIIRR